MPHFRRKDDGSVVSKNNLVQKRVVCELWLAVLVLVSGSVVGQQEPISLSTVTVRATAPERFLAGQKLQRIDSAALRQFRFQNLSDMLSVNSPLIFKNYGPGQLSTVSFRGTSPNHTAVLWNGINVNQPMTGQTDFSTLPAVGFDQVSVQYGSAASVVGSDAVGGSLILRALPNYNEPGLKASAGYQLSSFQNQQAQAVLYYAGSETGQGQFAGKTVVYGNQFNNRYPYRERGYYYVEPANSYQRGLMQDLFWRNRHNNQWSLNTWFTDNSVTIAPDDVLGRERTRTQNYRILSSFEADKWTVRVGWLRDVLDYAKADFTKPSHSLTDRFLTRLEREFTHGPWQVRVGGEAVHYRSWVDGYGGQLITENRADLYALFRYQANQLTVSANVRQGFVTRFNPPLTPSLGVDYKILQREKGGLTARASVGRSYRVPTLNERYWEGLGNPNLRPESGLNAEMGLTGRVQPSPTWLLTTDLTAYRNRIDDWTYWNPDRNYRVENLQLVLTQGLETAATVAYVKGRWRAGGRLGYAFTKSSQQRAYDVYARDIVGKQLPYVPVHNTSLTAYVEHQKVRLTVRNQLQSLRYNTFDNSQSLPGIMLTDLVAQAPFRLGSVKMQLQGQVNNLFDALVLNVKRNAMPGRNYALSVVLEK